MDPLVRWPIVQSWLGMFHVFHHQYGTLSSLAVILAKKCFYFRPPVECMICFVRTLFTRFISQHVFSTFGKPYSNLEERKANSRILFGLGCLREFYLELYAFIINVGTLFRI